ncbi:two-component sensor histidine kinase [Terrabacter tumescens]|uniref:Two-component sensor histidine kinase n=1 Tax=Terrabacter tumescens TaxID=60443 RepID=A0ABQ2HSD8_9MICO|nr:sensor histidine kinase [Terrabacter tumescens]GGM90306.1 two-component sensor histidine kinase [Terrabacter tumescens]
MEEGILAPVARLDRWLDAVLVALLVTCSVRYLLRHDLDGTAVLVLAGAAVLGAAHLTRRRVADRGAWPTVWIAVVVALWVTLTLVAPSFAWTAVPVAFAVLQVLPFAYAVTVVVGMTAVVSVAWSRIATDLDPTVLVGPVGIALVTVLSYRALDREARTRQALLDELTEAQADLATAQRRSGALTERTRLSREIHDSVGQGLSSITLLLGAAEQDWDKRPLAARDHVTAAGAAARDALDEVRRVVRDLAPADLEDDTTGDALPAALARVAATGSHGLDVQVRVHGDAVPVPSTVAGALVRSARGALANVVEHAHATRAVVSLTYLPDEVLLDVRDDGQGFDPAEPTPSGPGGDRGHGVDGIRRRAADLGGRAEVESAPREGTTVSVRFPLGTGDRHG